MREGVMDPSTAITRLLSNWRQSNGAALDHTLQPTALQIVSSPERIALVDAVQEMRPAHAGLFRHVSHMAAAEAE